MGHYPGICKITQLEPIFILSTNFKDIRSVHFKVAFPWVIQLMNNLQLAIKKHFPHCSGRRYFLR